MERIIKRGDIFYAELNPVIGSEQGGTRPVLIISNNTGNRQSPTVIIAPITSRTHTKAKLPTHTEVQDFDKLDKDSIILLEQIRTIDKQRLKQYMGMIPDNIMARVDKALAISISLNNRPDRKCAN
ncbi:MAG: type II toxin-antitoxin system PemK/MazF family toxin [bacterium]|nr:type II toxin-antitoxin system PemK/MazF family toxin [bacterium]